MSGARAIRFGFLHVVPPPIWVDGGSTVTQPFALTSDMAYFKVLPGGALFNLQNGFARSTDNGATWTQHGPIASNYYGWLAHGDHNGRIVNFGNWIGYPEAWYCSNPFAATPTWQTITGPSMQTVKPGSLATTGAVGNGKVVLAYSDGDVIYCDAELMNGFTKIAGAIPATSSFSRHMIFTGTHFVSIGITNGTVATSTDGISWTTQTPISGTNLNFYSQPVVGNGRIFLFGSGSPTNKVHISADNGVSWTTSTLPFTANLFSPMAYAYGRLHFINYNSSQAAYSDDNGATWTTVALPSSRTIQNAIPLADRIILLTSNNNDPAYLPL